MIENLLPDFPVVGRDGEEIGDLPSFGLGMKGNRGEEQSADNSNGAQNIEPVFGYPKKSPSFLSMDARDSGCASYPP